MTMSGHFRDAEVNHLGVQTCPRDISSGVGRREPTKDGLFSARNDRRGDGRNDARHLRYAAPILPRPRANPFEMVVTFRTPASFCFLTNCLSCPHSAGRIGRGGHALGSDDNVTTTSLFIDGTGVPRCAANKVRIPCPPRPRPLPHVSSFRWEGRGGVRRVGSVGVRRQGSTGRAMLSLRP